MCNTSSWFGVFIADNITKDSRVLSVTHPGMLEQRTWVRWGTRTAWRCTRVDTQHGTFACVVLLHIIDDLENSI